METHHPHHVTHKKKWAEYLLEFFMLFLAVFLGFVAENIREATADKNREKEYLKTLIEDIKLDSIDLVKCINFRGKQVKRVDSLLDLFHRPDRKNYTSDIYYFQRWLFRTQDFYYHDRTIQQLKNSGSLRLIHGSGISDSIILYDDWVRVIENQQRVGETFQWQAISDLGAKIFDPAVFREMENSQPDTHLWIKRPDNNPPLISNDNQLINELLAHDEQLKSIYKASARIDQSLILKGSNLITIINKQYHLK